MAVSFKGAHFPKDVIPTCVRWYVAYPLSTRQVEDLMIERGVNVDHATINRWVITYSPQLEEAFHQRKRPVWVSWRRDETYIRVKGQWYYLYRAVDKTGQTVDFLLTEQRDERAATRFLTKALRRATGCPKRSPSAEVRPMRRPSGATTRRMARRSSSGRSSTSIISSSKTIAG
jgi:putative transposase